MKQKTRLSDAPAIPPKDRKSKRKYFTVEEWKSLLAAAKADSTYASAMVLLIYEAGLRASEVGVMRLSYLKSLHESRRVFVWRGKGSKGDYVTVTDTCAKALFAWVKQLYPEKEGRHGNLFLFPGYHYGKPKKGISSKTVYRLIQRLGAQADVPKEVAHPHALKHSRVQHLLEAASKENIAPEKLYQSIADLIGHRSAQTTIQHYAAATGAEKQLIDRITKELVE